MNSYFPKRDVITIITSIVLSMVALGACLESTKMPNITGDAPQNILLVAKV